MDPDRSRSITTAGILGSFDGLCSIMGLLATFSAIDPTHARRMVLGAAVGVALSMGGGEYLASDDLGLVPVAVMGAASLGGVLVPGLPYVIAGGSSATVAVSIALALVACAAIAAVRSTAEPRARAWRHTFLLFGICAVGSYLTAVATGAV